MTLKKVMAELGSKGGSAKGKSKSRGDSAYYKRLAKRSNLAQKRKKARA